ncbi:MAG: DNA-processing protein DprA [Clostridia bacterium]|nr:DNA-processing protein DprA [Clostridia bacterium]
MIWSYDAKNRFLLLNDISESPTLSLEEFIKLESKIYNKDFSILESAELWEIVEKTDNKATAEKIYSALKKSEELELLKKNKIGLLSVNDEFYPQRLKEKLDYFPPFFYFLGDERLINKPSTAVTGSRNADEKGLEFARDIGQAIASENKILVSGGARGCDFEATAEAIESGGKAVWFLANPMKNILKNRLVTEWIESGKLCMLSDFNPFGEFDRKQALARNRFIYANSEISFVCECKSRISGTFSGASFCLKNNLSQLFVFDNNESAVKELISHGAVSIIK